MPFFREMPSLSQKVWLLFAQLSWLVAMMERGAFSVTISNC
ncbi:hypothetical protein JCM19239_3469 [Vibrio variabilis]|uniref:Uncharacterized protein n=1 Tax=Vibrio variabilis TaxID=990271 RepID=A0ABQ0JGY6_9VIBR|nr:hypothetical protein JCM19239_3469 [Vibrio variabilis]